LEFIDTVKHNYDEYLNEGKNKPIKLFILNPETLARLFSRCFNIDDPFAGQSVELPITPFDIAGCIVAIHRCYYYENRKERNVFIFS